MAANNTILMDALNAVKHTMLKMEFVFLIGVTNQKMDIAKYVEVITD